MHYKILFHLSQISESDISKLQYYLKTHPNVVYSVDVIGLCDVYVELMLSGQKEFFEFIRDLKFAFPSLIKDYETMIISDALKINYLPYDLRIN